MTHELFGKMRFKDRDESWAGSALLPRFAAVGMRPEAPEMTEEEARQMTAEMNAALDNMREMMRERFGDQIDAAFAEIDRETEAELRRLEEEPEEPDPKEEERERKAAARREKRAALLAKGKFPFRVGGSVESPPTAAQEAAFRFLRDNEEAVFHAILAQVWDSYQSRHWPNVPGMKPVEGPADLEGQFAIPRVDIAWAARGGFAHLMFPLDAPWEDEHGLIVVYSPDTRAASWTTWDGLDELLESDEPQPEEEEYIPTPHDELVEAIIQGDDAKARELVAAGADINALTPDECPPVWAAVDQLDPELLQRLLACGADPNAPDPEERTTPLKHAKRLYRNLGFAPAKNRDALQEGVLSMMHDAMSNQMTEIKTRLEAVVKLLKDAGATT
jgi:hypothetical protein